MQNLSAFYFYKEFILSANSSLQKDSAAVTEALDQLREVGWAKQWSSQPYVSRRTVSPQLQV